MFNKKSIRYLLLFFIAFTIKLSTCFYLAYLGKCSTSEYINTILATKSGDAASYLDPVDNFIEKEEYGLTENHLGRAPYYGTIYYIFRIFFSKNISYDLVIIFQILVEAIAIVYLSSLAAKVIKRSSAFWLTYLLMLISLNTTFFSYYLLTESLSISFLIIFCYYYYIYLTTKKTSNLFHAGIFLCFVVLLKPYFGLLYILIGIEFILKKPYNVKTIFINTFIVSLPLVILIVPYTIRNYVKFNVFQPFQPLYAGYQYTSADLAYRNFVRAWGGSFVYWDKRSAGCYFEPKPNLPCEYQFPDYAFCEGYTMKEIEEVRNLYIRYKEHRSTILEDTVVHSFNHLTSLYKDHRPIRYYLITPFISAKEFLFHSGSYFLPIRKDFPCYKNYQILIKISQSLLYYFTLFIGFLGLVFLLIKDKKSFMLLFIPIFLILFFPIFLRATEYRYFVNAYPLLIIGTSYFILLLYKKL